MFTGLIREVGRVARIDRDAAMTRLWVASDLAAVAEIGDSIAVNGVCLTVAEFAPEGARFDVLAQTCAVTSLGSCREGTLVNIEPALRLGDRLGGHFVSGHIDCVSEILSCEVINGDSVFRIALPAAHAPAMIDKGSIAVDGISLTVASLDADSFSVHLIPHTVAITNLQTGQAGTAVNLEFDLLGKYVARHLSLSGDNAWQGKFVSERTDSTDI